MGSWVMPWIAYSDAGLLFYRRASMERLSNMRVRTDRARDRDGRIGESIANVWARPGRGRHLRDAAQPRPWLQLGVASGTLDASAVTVRASPFWRMSH